MMEVMYGGTGSRQTFLPQLSDAPDNEDCEARMYMGVETQRRVCNIGRRLVEFCEINAFEVL
jgi:hypothetical protein